MSKVEKLRHLGTTDAVAKAKAAVVDPGPARPGPRGPAVGEANLSDRDFVSLHSRPEDWKAMRAVLVARRAAAEPGADGAWRTLPDGSKIRATTVLAGCSVCGEWRWIEGKLMPAPCLCYGARQKKVMMRLATREEVSGWYIREEAKLAKLKADAPKRAAEVADFNRRRFEDGGIR